MAKELQEATEQDFNLALLDNDLSKMLEEETEGLTTTFDRVKIPSGGGLSFEIVGDDPDNPETVAELIGIIVDKHPANAYWKGEYGEAAAEGNLPDCSSLDGTFGIGNPGGNCETCPLNDWGSDPKDGRGKACKNLHRIYLILDGELLPVLLTLPPTSIKNFSNYIVKRVVSKGMRTSEVITKCYLRKAKNASGISYSQVFFKFVGQLTPEQIQKVQVFAASIKPLTRQVEISKDETSDGFDTPEFDKSDNEGLPI